METSLGFFCAKNVIKTAFFIKNIDKNKKSRYTIKKHRIFTKREECLFETTFVQEQF